MTQLETHDTDTATPDGSQRILDALTANFGSVPTRRAAHAKGIVLRGMFAPTAEASTISRAGHFVGGPVDVVARFSNFPGGQPGSDADGSANPRGLAVQFRLPDGSVSDLLAHSINGFPGRVGNDFAEFLEAIAPGDEGPGEYLAGHAAAARFVDAVQIHGAPMSYATLEYFAVNAFRFHDADDHTTAGRYTWRPSGGRRVLSDAQALGADANYLGRELRARMEAGPVDFTLELQVADPDDRTDDANLHWPHERRIVELGTLRLTSIVEDSTITEQGLFFDPVRLVDGITISDDPLLGARTRMYPLSLLRRHR